MDSAVSYDIIFYHSGRTAEAERLLQKRLESLRLIRRHSGAAVSPRELAKRLDRSLRRSDAVFIIGGLDGGKQSTDTILSLVLSSRGASLNCEKLVDEEGNISYLIRSQRQCIIVMPDEPEVMDAMLKKRLRDQLGTFYSLSDSSESPPPIEEITKELEKQLSASGPSMLSRENTYAREKRRELKRLQIIAFAVLAAGALLLCAGIIMCFI